ncbi:MAG TPA: retropepsin-like aspartic protease [Terracidiphilus sp.]|nr:retropepsin-like aspartic protease [Terracidiphilus sp.]
MAAENRWRWIASAACALALAATLPAQQPATETPKPAAAPPPDAQRQGQSEQVHTGVASGLDTEARLEALLNDHQFFRIEDQFAQMPTDQAQFYRGILANRDNDPKTSIQLLAPLVDRISASGNPQEEKLLRKALAEDYLRTGDMAKAAKEYQALEDRLQTRLTAAEQDEIELPLKLAPLAAANPPMTVEPYEPFLLQVSHNPLGLTELPVYVDARPHSWMMDPTAPFNLIARSLAREAGLKVSDEFATIHSLTGRPMQVRMTVIPRFTIGGRITFRNMTAFVFEDADYAFPKTQYKVEGMLGYPALSALGSLTITADATVEVRPFKPMLAGEKEDPPTPGARFFLDGDQMIVALGAKGQERMFVVDASGQQTYLTSRYYDEHTEDFNGLKMALFSIPGAENKPPQPAFMAESVPLTIGPTEVQAHYIQVITQPIGLAALDDVYGVLGMDFLDQLKSYTFDYRTMRFSVRTE